MFWKVMKNRKHLALLILASMLISSCSVKYMAQEHKKASTPVAMTESIFEEREFSPYADGKWIGKAISYGCYREGQAPNFKGPSEAEILEDLNILKEHWNLIRVYGADDDTERILKVIHENQLPFKVMLGIWLENEEVHPEEKIDNEAQVNRGIFLANQYPEEVIAVNVGNETQVEWSSHRTNPDNLVKYIRQVRQATSVPVTTADDYNFWNKPESQRIAAEIDFIVLHAYALWNGQQLEYALTWTDSVYRDAQERHPNRTIAIGETGWATVYNPEKNQPWEQGGLMKGEVSLRAQEQFLVEIDHWIDENQVTTFLFEAFDEPWKGGGDESGPNEVEKNWGVFYENRTPKPSLENFLSNIMK